MDSIDDSENNAKVSDSAYSTSCSNSQSRRSHSSKSTHSGSHSSGSSGYGGRKPSASVHSPKTSGLTQTLEKRAKKSTSEPMIADAGGDAQVCTVQSSTIFEVPAEDNANVSQSLEPECVNSGQEVEYMDISTSEKNNTKSEEMGDYNAVCTAPNQNQNKHVRPPSRNTTTINYGSDGFSCVISMHDGMVMYTTPSLTSALGYPKELWMGRSFIDFIHPKDRDTFVAQITSVLASPKNTNATLQKANSGNNSDSTTVSRIRRYRGISLGYGVKDGIVDFTPFLMKLSFTNVDEEEGNIMYLVIHATPFSSAFKIPNEPVTKATPFIIRHSANGTLEYISTEAVPYLGYLPQDMINKDALVLYHHEDLPYLRQVYKTIVKEGGMPRCKSYRMQAQNGDYVRVETEWISFKNPWSKKLEFVIGRHFVVEGPTKVDVFEAPNPEKEMPLFEEEYSDVSALRENIVRIMNEVLNKPGEMAKQQMTKSCQELASFLESLMEEGQKMDEELRVEIQDTSHSYYERDSVMLGGISPHHEYSSDSISSNSTPLSYNKLNYTETLQRYFESNTINEKEVDKTQTEDVATANFCTPASSTWLSKTTPQTADSGSFEIVSSSNDSTFLTLSEGSQKTWTGDYKPLRLTESLINKHNTEMEKELCKRHREIRFITKVDWQKSNETHQKKKEHLARCNASFHPTTAELLSIPLQQSQHGLKRTLKISEADSGTNQQHCSSLQPPKRRSVSVTPTNNNNAEVSWSNTGNNNDAFILSLGIPQPMSFVKPAPNPGMTPMHHAPAQAPSGIATLSTDNINDPNKTTPTYQSPMQSMIYGQAVYGGQPFMYSPMTHPLPYNMQPTTSTSTAQLDNMHAFGLASSNYEDVVRACKISLPEKSRQGCGNLWRNKIQQEMLNDASKTDQGSSDSNSPKNTLLRNAKAVVKPSGRNCQEKIDEESSYSSFYSSFFITESGSADDSDTKKTPIKDEKANLDKTQGYFEPTEKKVNKRKMDPPWLDQIGVTPNLMYKYRLKTKTMEEILKGDKLKMKNVEQPSLVNEQLGQLYLDLQLEGVAARLTLEEGITSSSSSGEESPSKITKVAPKKRQYSKLMMIYEEDAPFPPPPPEIEEPMPSAST